MPDDSTIAMDKQTEAENRFYEAAYDFIAAEAKLEKTKPQPDIIGMCLRVQNMMNIIYRMYIHAMWEGFMRAMAEPDTEEQNENARN